MPNARRARLAILAAATFVTGAGAVATLAAAMTSDQATQSFSLSPFPVNLRVLAGVVDSLITGLGVFLYFYRRQRYIRYWIAGWMLAAASAWVVAPPFTGWLELTAFGLSQFLRVASALAFVMSGDAYRARPRLRRAYAVVILPVLIWFVLSPVLTRSVDGVFAPGHLLAAGGLGAAGFVYLVLLRHSRMLGATIVGAMLMTLSALNAWLAVGVARPDAPEISQSVLLMLGAHLIMALGMQFMTFEDMTFELRLTNRRLETARTDLQQMVTTDPLTGCRNRRFFDDVIGREMERHRRYHIPLSLLFVDVDRFKAINDTLGHDAGDRVLQDVAAFLIRRVREPDYVFRWGGDEFLIVISCAEREAVRKGADLQAAFGATADAKSMPEGFGLSIGVAEVPSDAFDIMEVVNLADERMYANKKAARIRRA